MILKILGVIFAIILAIFAILGLSAMVFVAICLMDDQERENNRVNNKTSE